ncbi:hypothetical protein AB0I52_04995 [Streptomyces sp. NPDC050423]|uniref:hypothetical protein n=1 Tax=Streptomyces sp. NPDC050423 TaxID=3155402 RepID=UPI00341C5FBD
MNRRGLFAAAGALAAGGTVPAPATGRGAGAAAAAEPSGRTAEPLSHRYGSVVDHLCGVEVVVVDGHWRRAHRGRHP